MTKAAAKKAMVNHIEVEGGKPGTDEYDTGYIVSIAGDMANVAWNSGVRTPCPISDLRAA